MYPVYEYIKGQTVTLTEHMLSATELAKRYGLYTLNNHPNGMLVSNILADYVKENNLNAYFFNISLLFKYKLNFFIILLNNLYILSKRGSVSSTKLVNE